MSYTEQGKGRHHTCVGLMGKGGVREWISLDYVSVVGVQTGCDNMWLMDYYLRLDPCTELVLGLVHSSPVICVSVYGATCTLQWFISA